MEAPTRRSNAAASNWWACLVGGSWQGRGCRGAEPVAELRLCRQGIGAAAGVVIARCVERNVALTTLDLSFNSLGPEAGRALADALRVNRALTQLNLLRNEFVRPARAEPALAWPRGPLLRRPTRCVSLRSLPGCL